MLEAVRRLCGSETFVAGILLPLTTEQDLLCGNRERLSKSNGVAELSRRSLKRMARYHMPSAFSNLARSSAWELYYFRALSQV